MQEASGLSQEMFNLIYEQVIVTEHAPRDRFYLLERRHGLAETVECGAVVLIRPAHVRLPATAKARGHREVALPGRYDIIARADLYWRPGRHGRREHRPRARSGAPREPGRRGPVGSRRRLGPGLSRCVSFDF